jgi:hypothetical protein
MTKYRVCVIGGWCGNRLAMVVEHLSELLEKAGYPCQVKSHSVWENANQPPVSNLVLQLLPAFTEAETGCPVINIRPFLIDLDHPQTIEKIFAQIKLDFALNTQPQQLAGV